MKNQILILITLILLSCSKRQENIDLYISNSNYELNLKTGDFKINWYNNYKDKIELSKNEKNQIRKLIFKYNVDTFKGEKNVFGEELLIMPNFNDKFTLVINNKIESEISISKQVKLEKSKLNKIDTDIYNFKTEIFKLLSQNKDFERNMDTVKLANKKIKRLFL
ncbi:hypothetical protein [Flavobacterium crassostreae]|uniref:Lipoprotein n=1 Tax=Flavobacterium crassostreae TaxID=1763534 RepID=A0A1B9DSY5_9FLAO|nr:hypothetical protein [Flavobacterium crassostreae]OCB72828.1 hypothetical protein LPBF_11345 [Flavobacterium crassostreae]